VCESSSQYNFQNSCSLYFRAKWLTPILTGKPESPGKLELLRSRMDETLDMMENIWLAHDKKFMITNSITIADLLAACEVEQPSNTFFKIHKVTFS
jgi:glutathione S-transferase